MTKASSKYVPSPPPLFFGQGTGVATKGYMGERGDRLLKLDETVEDRLLIAGLRNLDVSDNKTSRARGPVVSETGQSNGKKKRNAATVFKSSPVQEARYFTCLGCWSIELAYASK